MPESRQLARSDGQSIQDAWLAGPARPEEADDVVSWLHARLLAADTLGMPAAIGQIEQWIRWFKKRALVPVEGRILPLDSAGATIEKLYNAGPASEDWPALAHYNGGLVPALGQEHIFVPQSPADHWQS